MKTQVASRYTAAHWGTYRVDGPPGDPRLAPIDDDPAPSPIARGWIDAARDTSTRIARPAVRKGWLERRETVNRCRDSFVEVDWDTALDLVAEELKRVTGEHGNQAIFAGSYGWASAGRFHHAQSQLRRFLNTIGGFVPARDTYSHAAAEVLLPHIVGMTNRSFQDNMTSLQLVADHCELLIAFGGISARTAQITSSGTSCHEVDGWLAKFAAGGSAVVNVSPQRSDFAAEGNVRWLAVRPNTDTALMLALAHTVLSKGLHDEAFLQTRCNGWRTFKAYLTGETDGIAKSAAWAAQICSVSEDEIIDLATEMARKRTMITLAWGIQRADHGEQPLWAGLALAAMLGQIGQPGTGFGFGYGSVTPVGRSGRLLPWPSVPQGVNPVSQFIPVARIADMLLHPGEEFAYNGGTHIYPHARIVWWAGGNPFHHHQDLYRLEEAWKRPDTVIVNEPWWTATAKRADIVLPVTTPLERDDIMMNRRDSALVWMSRLLEPAGEARCDHAVFRGLAERMGTGDAFTGGRDESEWLAWLWERAQAVARDHGFELPELDEFRRGGIFRCPHDDEHHIQLEDFARDPQASPLATSSGRIEIVSSAIAGFDLPDCPAHPTWIEPAEWLGGEMAKDGALHLVSGQPAPRLHGQLDNGSHSRAAKVAGREPVVIHPHTAAERGVTDGDVVRLFNDRGACLAGAVLSEDIRPDCVALATGAWFDPQNVDGQAIEAHGNPNVLTIDKGTSSLAQGNIAHTALVWMEKWTGPVPAVEAHRPPPIEPFDDVS